MSVVRIDLDSFDQVQYDQVTSISYNSSTKNITINYGTSSTITLSALSYKVAILW